MSEIFISGKGKLKVSDNEYYQRQCGNSSSVSLDICMGITEIETGFFDVFKNVTEVSIPDSVEKMGVSDTALKIFKKNNTVIRGSFDSVADKFAKDNNLPFMHSDIIIGYRNNDYGHEIITLCFKTSENPYIHENSVSPGMSGSSTGGGESYVNLVNDFFKKCSQEDLANKCWGCCYTSILNNERLKVFLQKAKSRNGYKRGI